MLKTCLNLATYNAKMLAALMVAVRCTTLFSLPRYVLRARPQGGEDLRKNGSTLT